MARKGWDALSENYRTRLTRKGVSREQYESGASLAAARGHKSAAHERVQSASYRNIDRYVDRYMSTYGAASDGNIHLKSGRIITRDDVRQTITRHGRAEAENLIRYQTRMEKAYDRGDTDRASAMYKLPRTAPYPDWMFYYHGSFS